MNGSTDTVRTDVRVNWPVAILCVVVLGMLHSMTVMPRVNYGALPRFPHTIFPSLINWVTWLPLIPPIFALAKFARVRDWHDARGIAILVAGAVFFAVVHIVLMTLVRKATGVATGPELSVLIPGMIRMTFANNFVQFWLFAGAFYALAYQNEVRDRAVNEAQMATRLAEARLEALESRMHPHFLFNTLNAVATLIHKDPAAAASMVENLGDLLRAALNAEPGRKVSLQHELQLLDRYVEIQKARFSDRLTVAVDAPADVGTALVPHMLLQPLVENAIRHGIAPREAPGSVSISARRDGAALKLEVRDDGVGFGKATQHVVPGSGFGLNSTRARLTHLYGNSFGFEIGDAAPSGTVVSITIPFDSALEAERSKVA